uniref:FixH family protein n=1 Tax=Pararhizobium sp. IMCC3301 TaxID=3067904 RepID=UPI00274298C4|nr:FixH family protein [Pararhizobium sp. IMCC3301]
MSLLKRIFTPEEFTGWHMAGVMGLFFGTIISVNLFLAFSASSSWTGLVVANTYVESQKFNSRAAEFQHQAELGWRAAPEYADGVFSVALTDASGRAIEPVEVEVKLGRPVHEGDDRRLQLRQAGGGRFEIETLLGAGIWEADLSVSDAGAVRWSRIFRFEVKG